MSKPKMSRSNDSYRLVQGVKLSRVEQNICVTPYRQKKFDADSVIADIPDAFDIPRYGNLG